MNLVEEPATEESKAMGGKTVASRSSWGLPTMLTNVGVY